VILGLIAAVCFWAAALGAARSAEWSSVELPPYSDVQLYRDGAQAIAHGHGYYAATTELHREHGFPTVPFVTVRLPTLAYAAAFLGWEILQLVLVGLLIACILTWRSALDNSIEKQTRLGVVLFTLAGGFVAFIPLAVPHHDQWAGLLLTLAIPLRAGKGWPIAVLCVALALAIRELAFPFALLALAFSVTEQRWRQSAAWGVLIIAFGIGMALHAHLVQAHVLPGDIQSPGWDGMRGPAGAISDVVEVSVLKLLPPMLAAPLAVLALIGWAGAPGHLRRFTLLWLLGFGTVLALFGRSNNTYWAVELMPAWLIGLAFLPGLIRDVWAAAMKPPRAPIPQGAGEVN
jgi:hypothetical protein